MLDLSGTREYWQERARRGDNPCHYHDKWQDAYAFNIRTKVFKKKDFNGVVQAVDIGSGIGDYTNKISKLTNAKFTGFDFPFNVQIAQGKYKENSQLNFIPASLPDEIVTDAISRADVVITTTVYVHLAPSARESLMSALEKMKAGSKVMLLEYAPNSIPSFQKNLKHKEIETPGEIAEKFSKRKFILKEVRHVNFIDSFLFHHLGTNFFTYYLTLFLENILRLIKYSKSKYKLLIFEKMA